MFPERIRQSDNTYTPEISYEYFGSPPGLTSQGTKTLGTKQVIMDVLSKHYRPGELRLNPVDIRKFSGHCTSGTLEGILHYWNGDRRYYWSGPIAAINASPVSDVSMPCILDSTAEKWAAQKAYAALSEPDLDVGMMLVEGNETLHMLRAPFKALVPKLKLVLDPVSRFLTAIDNRGKPALSIANGIRKAVDKSTNAWLLQRYGIMPLVLDINSIVEKYNSGFRKELNVLRRRSGGSTFASSTQVSETNEPWGVFRTFWRNTTTVERKTFCTVYFNESVYRDGIGVDYTDIPSLIWERIPYSFVVDWALGISTWLRAIQPKPGLNYLGASVSTVNSVSLERINTRAEFWKVGDGVIPATNSWYTSTQKKLYRWPGVTLPTAPILRLDCMNLTRSVDSLGLIWNQLPRPFHFKR